MFYSAIADICPSVRMSVHQYVCHLDGMLLCPLIEWVVVVHLVSQLLSLHFVRGYLLKSLCKVHTFNRLKVCECSFCAQMNDLRMTVHVFVCLYIRMYVCKCVYSERR